MALLWTLYCLAKNPDAQDAVYRNIQSVLPDGAPITADSLQQLRLVKASLKEAFRLAFSNLLFVVHMRICMYVQSMHNILLYACVCSEVSFVHRSVEVLIEVSFRNFIHSTVEFNFK
jgi:hypothetical protein